MLLHHIIVGFTVGWHAPIAHPVYHVPSIWTIIVKLIG